MADHGREVAEFLYRDCERFYAGLQETHAQCSALLDTKWRKSGATAVTKQLAELHGQIVDFHKLLMGTRALHEQLKQPFFELHYRQEVGFLCSSIQAMSEAVIDTLTTVEGYLKTLGEEGGLKPIYDSFGATYQFIATKTKRIDGITKAVYREEDAEHDGRPASVSVAFTAGKSKVHLMVKSNLDYARTFLFHDGTPTTIRHIAIDAARSSTDGDVQRWLSGLENEDPVVHSRLTYGCVSYVRQAFERVIRENPHLLRASRVDISVIVAMPEPGQAGCYVVSASSPSMVFIRVGADAAITEFFACRGVLPPFSTPLCNTVVHELTHAYDYRLNQSPEEFSALVRDLVGEDPTFETEVLCHALWMTRVEGLAKLRENMSAMIQGGRIAGAINLQGLTGVFREVSTLLSSAEMLRTETDIRNLLRSTTTTLEYEYGFFCCLIIMIDSLQNLELYVNGKVPYRINRSQFGAFLDREVMMHLPADQLQKFQNVIVKISLMDFEQFFYAYFRACEHLGVKDGVTIKGIISFNEKTAEANRELLSHLGFSVIEHRPDGFLQRLRDQFKRPRLQDRLS